MRAWDAMLGQAAHRPWPVPRVPWVMHMSWTSLLFAHWPLPPEEVRPSLPAGLELETHDGRAWIGLVPFRMEHVSLRGAPDLPGLSTFPETNLRTYVTAGGRPGVWFFSLDADQALAVAAARATFGLPYFRARMSCEREGAATRYASRRLHRGAPVAELGALYRPTGAAAEPRAGSFEHWLTERYCLYARRFGKLVRGEIHHPPWLLQPAALELGRESFFAAAGLTRPDAPPVLHYAERQDVVAWAPAVLGAARAGARGSS